MESNRIKLMNNKLSILSPDLGNAFKYAIFSLFFMFVPIIGFIIGFFMNLFIIYYLYQNNKKNNLDNYYHLLGLFGLIGVIIYSVKTATDSKGQIKDTIFSKNLVNQDNAPNTSSNSGSRKYEDDNFLNDDKTKSYGVVYEPVIDPKRVNKNNFQNNNFNNSPIAPQSGMQNFIIWVFAILLIFVLMVVYAVTYFIDKYGINFS